MNTKTTTGKKSTGKRNGVPGYKPKVIAATRGCTPRESTFVKLLMRPLHETGRSMRLIRKLNLQPARASTKD